MCIQDFTLFHCGCQVKGSLRECGEFQCSHIRDIAKQLPDFCQACQEKLDHGGSLPKRKPSTVKKITRSLSMRIGAKGHSRVRSTQGKTLKSPREVDDGWVNPFNEPL